MSKCRPTPTGPVPLHSASLPTHISGHHRRARSFLDDSSVAADGVKGDRGEVGLWLGHARALCGVALVKAKVVVCQAEAEDELVEISLPVQRARGGRSAATGACGQSLVSFSSLANRVIYASLCPKLTPWCPWPGRPDRRWRAPAACSPRQRPQRSRRPRCTLPRDRGRPQSRAWRRRWRLRR